MIKGNKLAGKAQEIIGNLLKPLPITPNEMTVASVLIAFIGLYFFMNTDYWMAIGLYALALLVDGLDGAVARAKCMASAKGAFLDGVADRFVEFIILLGLMAVALPTIAFPSNYWVMGMLFLGTGMTSFIRAYAEYTEAITMKAAQKMNGLFERAERALFILIIIGLIAIGDFGNAAVFLMAGTILALITVMQRFLAVIS